MHRPAADLAIDEDAAGSLDDEAVTADQSDPRARAGSVEGRDASPRRRRGQSLVAT